MSQSKTENAPYSLLRELEQMQITAPPPLHLWNPKQVSDIDLEIKADGTWFHEGSPIKRQRLVRLFSRVLKRERDGRYFLVTPVEKCPVRVEQLPFVAVLMHVVGAGEAQILQFTTNVADEISVDAEHPMTMETLHDGTRVPVVEVRAGLRAILSRNVYYQLMSLLTVASVDGELWYGVWSSGRFFTIQLAAEVDDSKA
jgi:uncharacterized protein